MGWGCEPDLNRLLALAEGRRRKRESLQTHKSGRGGPRPSRPRTGPATPGRSVCAPGGCPPQCTQTEEIPMRFVTWLRSLAPRPASPRPRRARLALEPLEERAVPSATSDFLYVGDNASNGKSANNSVQQFDAATGASLGTFVPGSNSLKGVMGLIFDGHGHLLVANQDVNRGKPGEIMKYDAATGAFEGDLVPFQDPHAPFSPRGVVLRDNVLYVANYTDGD